MATGTVTKGHQQLAVAARRRRSLAGPSAGTLLRQPDGGVVTIPEVTVVATPPVSLRAAVGSPDYYR